MIILLQQEVHGWIQRKSQSGHHYNHFQWYWWLSGHTHQEYSKADLSTCYEMYGWENEIRSRECWYVDFQLQTWEANTSFHYPLFIRYWMYFQSWLEKSYLKTWFAKLRIPHGRPFQEFRCSKESKYSELLQQPINHIHSIIFTQLTIKSTFIEAPRTGLDTSAKEPDENKMGGSNKRITMNRIKLNPQINFSTNVRASLRLLDVSLA